MKRFVMGILAVITALFMAGCGGSGTTGNGTTVFLTSQIKDGTSLVAFASISSGQFTSTPLSFTIKSTPYVTTGTVPKSDVSIDRILFNYSPALPGVPSFVPAMPYKSYGTTVTPGGTADIDNVSVITFADLSSVRSKVNHVSGTYQYNLDVTFTGTEVNTGTGLSTTTHSSMFIDIP